MSKDDAYDHAMSAEVHLKKIIETMPRGYKHAPDLILAAQHAIEWTKEIREVLVYGKIKK